MGMMCRYLRHAAENLALRIRDCRSRWTECRR